MPDTDWTAAWEAALAELELDVEAAEQMLAAREVAEAPHTTWQPPSGLGPLPVELADRARALLARQVETARRIGEAAALARRHARAAQGMRATGESRPVYVDTPA